MVYDGDGNVMHFIPNIQTIRSQKKTMQLLFNKYVYTKSNTHGNTTYWHCRSRRNGRSPCNARFLITKLKNGRYKVCLSQPEHNHPPTKRQYKQNK